MLGLVLTVIAPTLMWATVELAVAYWVKRQWFFFTPLVLVASLSLFTQPVIYLLLTVILIPCTWLMERKEMQNQGHWRPVAWHLLFGAVLLPLISGFSAWLPTEKIDVGGQKPVVGYVLRDGGNPVVILTDVHRQLSFVRPEDIKTRNVCEENMIWFDSLSRSFPDPPPQTKC